MDTTIQRKKFDFMVAGYDALLAKIPNTSEGLNVISDYQRLRASAVWQIGLAEIVFVPVYDLNMVVGRFDQEALKIFQA